VNRRACRIAPAATSSKRARPGRIGRPAASALVQPFGRSLFERRFQIAPEPPYHYPPDLSASKNFAVGGFAVPQFGQAWASGVAHSVQNLAPTRFSVPQFEQITRGE